jgi:hypothetical protein
MQDIMSYTVILQNYFVINEMLTMFLLHLTCLFIIESMLSLDWHIKSNSASETIFLVVSVESLKHIHPLGPENTLLWTYIRNQWCMLMFICKNASCNVICNITLGNRKNTQKVCIKNLCDKMVYNYYFLFLSFSTSCQTDINSFSFFRWMNNNSIKRLY